MYDGDEEEVEQFDVKAAAEAIDNETNPPKRFDALDFASEMLDSVGRIFDQLGEFAYIPCRHLLGHAKWRRQREQMIRTSRHEIELLTGGTDG